VTCVEILFFLLVEELSPGPSPRYVPHAPWRLAKDTAKVPSTQQKEREVRTSVIPWLRGRSLKSCHGGTEARRHASLSPPVACSEVCRPVCRAPSSHVMRRTGKPLDKLPRQGRKKRIACSRRFAQAHRCNRVDLIQSSVQKRNVSPFTVKFGRWIGTVFAPITIITMPATIITPPVTMIGTVTSS